MLRLLGQFSFFGSRARIERFAAVASIPGAVIRRVGSKRKIPTADSWCYSSPWYRFRLESIDEELRDYMLAHARLGDALAVPDEEMQYAFFTLCPVDQSSREALACVLSRETLQVLSRLGVAFQIAPASVMPDAPFWREQAVAS